MTAADPVALYDFLECAAGAVLAAEGGYAAQAETALLEAQLAASTAFPAGSPRADALGVVLAAVAQVNAGDGWTGSSYCSACWQRHPGQCGCDCHRPAAPAAPRGEGSRG